MKEDKGNMENSDWKEVDMSQEEEARSGVLIKKTFS